MADFGEAGKSRSGEASKFGVELDGKSFVGYAASETQAIELCRFEQEIRHARHQRAWPIAEEDQRRPESVASPLRAVESRLERPAKDLEPKDLEAEKPAGDAKPPEVEQLGIPAEPERMRRRIPLVDPLA